MKLFISLCLASMVFFTSQAFAVLNLELTQGINAKIPIAVVPFSGNPNFAVVSQVITADLAKTGQFALLPADKFPQAPHALSQVKFSAWRNLGIDNLVVGNMTSLPSYRVQVAVDLMNVFNSAPQALLSGEKYQISVSQLRALGHHIADALYQQLTGERGVFSTKLATIVVQRGVNQLTHYELRISDFDGSHSQILLNSVLPIMAPAWSPQGNSIAYVSFETGTPAIYMVNIATGARHLVVHFPGVNSSPAWSPDGKQLAVALSGKLGPPKLYEINVNTTRLTQLTFGKSIDTEPSFSPDGKFILFTSNRSGSPQVYEMNRATSQVNRLTYQGSYNASAHFLPNGKGIVLLHRDSAGFSIALLNLQTGAMRALTPPGAEESPAVSPNGQFVLYTKSIGGQHALMMTSLTGGVTTRVPTPWGSAQEPTWSPYEN